MLELPVNMTQTYDYERVCRDFQPPTCGSYFSFAVDTLDHHAMRYPNAPAIWVSSLELQQYQISYGQLKERSQRAARAFWNAGVRKGDKVIMVMDRYVRDTISVFPLLRRNSRLAIDVPRRVEWAEVALGLMRIGAIISPGVSLLMPKGELLGTSLFAGGKGRLVWLACF